jgi:hypothetical protein
MDSGEQQGGEELDVEEYVVRHLTRHCIHCGDINQAEETANKTAEALARLINILGDKGVLTLYDIKRII